MKDSWKLLKHAAGIACFAGRPEPYDDSDADLPILMLLFLLYFAICVHSPNLHVYIYFAVDHNNPLHVSFVSDLGGRRCVDKPESNEPKFLLNS